MNLRVLAFSLLFVTGYAPCQQGQADTRPDVDPRVRGAHTFTESGCPQCHSIHGQGGTKGPDLSDVGHRLKQDQIRTQIVKGGKQMPSFGQVLEPSEVDDLVAYLSSLKDDLKSDKKQ